MLSKIFNTGADECLEVDCSSIQRSILATCCPVIQVFDCDISIVLRAQCMQVKDVPLVRVRIL